jgi:hypothetical protein
VTVGESNQKLVDNYLERAIGEFDRNRLSTRLIRRLSEEFPGLFFTAALRYLNTSDQSNALRFLATVALRQRAMLEYLTTPEISSRDHALTLFRRFLDVDPSFDLKLAERLPNRRESNLDEALDGNRSTRALDILDVTSRGGRLLPMVGHLPGHRDTRLSAKATLFVGRRVQNPEWAKKLLLEQPDHRVRANAVESLWGFDSPAAVQLLEECAGDRNNRVLGNSLVGLYLLGRSDAQRQALALASSDAWELRSTAAWVVGKMGGDGALECLTGMVRDEHPQVRSTALRSLLELRRTQPKPVAPDPAPAPQKTAGPADNVPVDPDIRLRLDGTSFKVP